MLTESTAGRPLRCARCAIYKRYSTNIQRPASLEDQERNCRELAAQMNWEVLDAYIYQDAALSGTTKAGRKGLGCLQAAAQSSPRPFEYVLVDDTSRLSRDLSDVLDITQDLKDNGVEVYFVSQRLDSRDESFRMRLGIYGIIDEQYITRLRQKVRSGLEGRCLKGYNAGSLPYGYRSFAVLSSNPNAVGRAATEGMRLEVNEEQAIIIRRIFEWYSDGHSIFRIVRMLNIERVPWPHASHGKWGPDAIKRILHNEKYRGVNRFGMTSQPKNRRTGQVTKKIHPIEEHKRVELPHLRIVTDELWNRAAFRLKELNDKQDARKLGNYNRSQDRVYPYSGLLICGICGRAMNLGGKQGKGVYECRNHRRSAGCTNALRISEATATKQITEALAKQLLLPETMSYLVAAVYRELSKSLESIKKDLPPNGVQELESKLHSCIEKINNLVDAIADTGADVLKAKLVQFETERKRIDKDVRIARAAKNASLTQEHLEALVKQNATNLLDVLYADAVLARTVLQRHVGKLSLYPSEIAGKPVFEVIGELDLFAAPVSSNDGVPVGVSGTLSDHGHTVDSSFRFTMTIDCSSKPKCTILEPLCGLLAAHPELADSPKTPSNWARLINEFITDGPDKPKDLGYGAVARAYWFHRNELEERLIMSKLPNPDSRNAGHVYQFALRFSANTGNNASDNAPDATTVAA